MYSSLIVNKCEDATEEAETNMSRHSLCALKLKFKIQKKKLKHKYIYRLDTQNKCKLVDYVVQHTGFLIKKN